MSALIPEWAPQEGVLLVWPHPYSDWADSLEQIEQSYAQMAAAITRHEQLLMVCYDDAIQTRALDLSQRAGANLNAIRCHQIKSNDTWARDFGPLTTIKENTLLINDFGFNGWGKKFDARLDNQINAALRDQKAFGDVEYESYSMILEGGSIECDGHGTLMTTSSCLLTDTRNPELSKEQL
ncbi:MAG: agmatine deiminase family protein, partial [Gammaproteobacteria bacterium]|nr:agmatine deiminase family protein [Gammaproteobacteria bacterium]